VAGAGVNDITRCRASKLVCEFKPFVLDLKKLFTDAEKLRCAYMNRHSSKYWSKEVINNNKILKGISS
jgi:hypothetical protein